MPIAAAASAHGRLLDAATGHPLKDIEVTYFLWLGGSQSGRECGGTLKTDEHGNFSVAGLVPGWGWQFHAVNGRGNRHLREDLTRLTSERAGEFDLGDFRVDPGGNARRDLVGPVMPATAPKIYYTKTDGNAQVAAARQKAKAEDKRVLLVFGANWSAACHRLDACFDENAEVATVLRESYVVVLIDVETRATGGHDADVAKGYGHSTALNRLPQLMVLNAEGEQLGNTGIEQLENGELQYPQQILAFLNRSKFGGQNDVRQRRAPRANKAK